MESYLGLYYPFMEFNNDNWIKLAALYWEKLGRIVPKRYRSPLDSDTVRLLTDELGFIQNLYPTERNKEHAGKMFLEVLTKYEQELRQRYSIKSDSSTVENDVYQLEYESYMQEHVQALLKYEEASSIILTKGSGGKLGPLLANALEAKELIKTIKQAKNPKVQNSILEQHTPTFYARMEARRRAAWREQSKEEITRRPLYVPDSRETEELILIHPKLAFIYVEVLADIMASERKLHLVTDDLFSHVATSGYTVERLVQVLLPFERPDTLFAPSYSQGSEIEQHIAAVALRSVIPRDLSNIPAKKIVQIRTKYRDEMIAFQNAIHILSSDKTDLSDINDIEAFKMHIETLYERELKPQLNDFKKMLNSLGIDTVTSAMSIQVALPPLLASVLTAGEAYLHFPSLNPVILGGGALACSIFPVIRKMQEEGKQKVRSSPMSYLFYIQEQLEPMNVVKSVSHQARKVLFRI